MALGRTNPQLRLDRSLQSLICSLHKSPCLEPAPADRSLNRAHQRDRSRSDSKTLKGPKDELQNRNRKRRKRTGEKPLAKKREGYPASVARNIIGSISQPA